MTDLLLTVAEISLSTSLVILGLLVFSKGLHKRYPSKWKYFIWIALAVRLAVPVKLELPQKEIVLEMPASLAAPIVSNPQPLENLTNTVTALPQAPQGPSISPLQILAVIWLVGAAAFLLAHIGSYRVYRRQVVLGGEPVRDHDTLKLVRELARELGIRYRIPVRIYAGASSPMVLGFFRPMLVLPEMDYQAEELGFVLRHELIHLKRHDIFFKLLFVIANAIHWFNPLVYIMRSQAVVDMELSCDETVVQNGSYDTRKAYTETLLATLCRQHEKATGFSTQFYGGKKVMKLRFKNLLTKGKKRNGLIVFLAAVVIIAVFGTVIGFTTGDPDDPTPTGTEITWASLDFGEAFGMGDREAMAALLDKTYKGDMEVYPFPERELADDGYLFNLVEDIPKFGDISNHSIFYPSTFSKSVPLGSTYTVKVREGDKPDGDHLILSLIHREDGWKVRDYAFVDVPKVDPQNPMPTGEEIFAAARAFGRAFAAGDLEAMQDLMAETYEGEVKAHPYPDPDNAERMFEGIQNAEQPGDISSTLGDDPSLGSKSVPLGSTYTVKLRDSSVPDSDYLIVTLVKQEDGWKVRDYAFVRWLDEELGASAAGETDLAALEQTEGNAALDVAYRFTEAWAQGDADGIKPLLATAFQGTIQVNQSPKYRLNGPLGHDLYGMISPEPDDDIDQFEVNVGCVLKLGMKLNSLGDVLNLSLVRQEDGWKVIRYELVTGDEADAALDTERREQERIEKLLLDKGLDHYAYMKIDEAPAELRPVILEARHRIILSSDWVDDEQDAWVLDENGNKIEEVPHFSEVFPEDWEIPVEKMTDDEKLAHSRLQNLIDPERAEIMAMFQNSMHFTRAYIEGDMDKMQSYLAYSYMEPAVYETEGVKLDDMTGRISFAPVPGDISTDINVSVSVFSKFIPLGSRMTMEVDLSGFGLPTDHERFVIMLTRMEDGWKVADYGFIIQGPIATESDARQIEALVKTFADDFFAGKSAKELRGYLSTPYDEFSDNFAGFDGFLSIANYRNLPKAGNMLPADGYVPVVVEFYTQESPDAYRYLELKLVREGNDWKIYSYIVDV